MYGNETYPGSRRIFSRPYFCYMWGELPSQEEKNIAAFRAALHEVGDDLIGEPFDLCLDLDSGIRGDRYHFSPTFWNEDLIVEFSKTANYVTYQKRLSSDGGRALDWIVDHIVEHKKSQILTRRNGYNEVHYEVPYDLSRLGESFKAIWKDDDLIDPRLTWAEDLFFTCGDDMAQIESKKSFHFMEEGALEASLRWMARPDVAEQIAGKFLYSRLAQHYSEVDTRSMELARNVAWFIQTGQEDKVLHTLTQEPYAYALEFKKETKIAFPWADTVLNHLLPGTTITLTVAQGGELLPVLEQHKLRESAPHIVRDFKRLADGSWAKSILDRMNPSSPQVRPNALQDHLAL